MNDEEIRKTIEEVKAQVKAKPENQEKSEDEIDEMILDGFFKAYTEGKMSKEDLEAIAGTMGYEFTEDFDQDQEAAPEIQPAEGGEEGEGMEGMSKEELEDTRTIAPGESEEDFKDKIDEASEEETEEGSEEGEEEDSEEEERKKASELWKMNLNK